MAKLVQVTPITIVYGTYSEHNELVTGVSKPTYNSASLCKIS